MIPRKFMYQSSFNEHNGKVDRKKLLSEVTADAYGSFIFSLIVACIIPTIIVI